MRWLDRSQFSRRSGFNTIPSCISWGLVFYSKVFGTLGAALVSASVHLVPRLNTEDDTAKFVRIEQIALAN